MSSWKSYKLGDIAEITSSKRIFYSEYTSSGIPFWRSKEVIEKFNRKNISTDLFISNEKYETLKQKQPNLFDFEMKNNHSPLYILKLDKINIEEAIFTEEYCEFKKEDYDNPVFDEKLLFLNIIYSKIENRTKEILGII